ADADVHADEPLERGSEAGQTRGASGENDLADPERIGLALVELKRGDQLAGEALQRSVERLPGESSLLRRETFGHLGAFESDIRLEKLGGLDVHVQRSRKGD